MTSSDPDAYFIYFLAFMLASTFGWLATMIKISTRRSKPVKLPPRQPRVFWTRDKRNNA